MTGTQFEGLRNADNPSASTPPDVQGAIGPAHYVEMVNIMGRVYTRAGAVVATFDLRDFFAVPFANRHRVSDPKIQFDALSNRWIATFLDWGTLTGELTLAVSATSDPTGQWFLYPMSTTNQPDYPAIGTSDDKIVLTANAYPLAGGSFLGAEYWVINKAEALAGAASVSTSFSSPDVSVFTVRPAQAAGPTSLVYMVAKDANFADTVWLFGITGVPGISSVSVIATDLTVSLIAAPPDASQQGSATLLETGDGRLLDAEWRSGVLWTATADRCSWPGDTFDRACLHLIAIDTSTPTVLQDFRFGALGNEYFYPALRTDAGGNLVVVFGRSSSAEYPNLRYTYRLASDTPGTLRSSTSLRVGEAPDVSGRYGDYFAAAFDPVRGGNIWVAGEYVRSSLSTWPWATYVAQVSTGAFETTPPAITAAAIADQTSASTEWTNSATVDFSVSASDAVGVTAYYVADSDPVPAAQAPGWTGSAPVTLSLVGGDGPYAAYVWARDSAGNVSGTGTATISLDTVAPTRSFNITPTVTNSTTVAITISGTDTGGSGVNGYCVKSTSSAPAEDDPCFVASAPATASIGSGEGTKTLFAWTRDAAGNVSTTASDTVVLDTSAPTRSFNITPAATNSTTVAITISGTDIGGSGVDGYCVKASSTVPTASDPCFVGSAPVTAPLSGSDGTKTLFAWTRDAAGNVSTTASDTVTLDRVAPSVTFDITRAAVNTNTASVTLTGADTGGSGVNGYCVKESASVPASTDGCFQPVAPSTAPIPPDDGPKTLNAWTRDAAGNVSTTASDTVLLDTTQPTVTLDITPGATNASPVAITMSGTDTGGSGVNGYCVKSSAADPLPGDACFTASAPTTAAIAGPDGSKDLYAWTRDVAGNVSASGTDSVLLDTAAPSASLQVNTPSPTGSRDVEVTLSGDDGVGSGVAAFLITESSTPPLSGSPSWLGVTPSSFHLVSAGDGAKTLRGWVKDAAGNVSAASSANITLDEAAPSLTFTIAEIASNGTVNLGFSAPDSDITAYLVTTTSTPPGVGDAGWTASAPATFGLTGLDGSKTLYGWAKDGTGHVSAESSDSVLLDTAAPSITFDITPSLSRSTTVALTVSGGDPGGSGLNGYCVKSSATVPSANDACFAASAPTSGVIPGPDGTNTLHAWTRDAAGNVSTGGSDTVTLDSTAPSVTFDIVPSLVNTTTVEVSVGGTDAGGSGVDAYCVRASASVPAPSDPCFLASAPGTALLTGGDGTNTLHAWTRDLAGNVSDAATDTVALDTTAPTRSFGITPTVTNSTTVDVTLSGTDTGGSGVTGYCVKSSSADPAPGDACFVASAPTNAQLAGGDGTNTLYAWTRDAAGNVSTMASDTVTLDTIPPSASLNVIPALTNSTTIAITVAGGDPGGSGVTGYCVKSSADVPAAASQCFEASAPATFAIAAPDGGKQVHAWTRDAAGNVSTAATDTVVLDQTRPTAVFNIVPATTASLTVAITLSGADASGVNGYLVRPSASPPTATDPAWLSAAPTTAAVALPDGTKTLNAWIRDAAGNVSLTASDTVVLDTDVATLDVTPPVATITAPKLTRTRTIAVTIKGTDAVGVTGYFVSESASTPVAGAPGWTGVAPSTFALSSGDGVKTVRAWAKDAAGNVSAAASATVRLDTKPPTSTIKTPSAKAVTSFAKFTGTAADANGSGLKQVEVSLRRQVTKTTCEHWNGRKWVTGACTKLFWLKAKGTATWTLALPKQTAAGAYTVQTAALDVAGNRQAKFVLGVNLRRFTIAPGGGRADGRHGER